MSNHDEIRELLPLVASGDVTAEEVRQVQDHLLQCENCRHSREELDSLAESLRSVPTPQPRPELVRRVLRAAAERLSSQKEPASPSRLLAPLIALSWIFAIVTWPMAAGLGSWVSSHIKQSIQPFETVLVAYSLLGFLLASVAAFAVVRHSSAPRRTR